MQGYVERGLEPDIEERLKDVPAVGILGSRQCGKSTLARHLLQNRTDALYLDLERPADRNKLRDPEAFLDANRERLVCLDEIQRVPEIFPLLRGVIDRRERNGQFIILGSASRELLRQSSESLAGRISYFELTPFVVHEVDRGEEHPRDLWLRGGYPRSFLARTNAASFRWREDFIRTFLERDLPQLAIRTSTERMGRFWQMCAHYHGQLMNYSKLAGSLGVNDHTVRSYLELLAGTFMVRILRPYGINTKKRLVKSPKVYIRDAGLLHALLDLEEWNDLFGHPVYGESWEGFAMENILPRLKPAVGYGFYRTAAGAELDLVLSRGRQLVALEFKASSSPTVERGFWNALADVGARHAWVVAPVGEAFPFADNVTVTPIDSLHQDPALRPFFQ